MLQERRVLSDENLRLTAQIGSNSAAEAHSSGTFSVPTIRRNEEFANSVTSSSISGAASESNTPLHSTSSNLESTIVDSAANIAPNASPSETAATINPLNVQVICYFKQRKILDNYNFNYIWQSAVLS